MNSEFVYGGNGKTKVFHGERIIHTHIRYIDHYRLFILKNQPRTAENDEINNIIVNFIEEYIEIGRQNPNVLSSKSEELFEEFEKKIQLIKETKYSDYITPINV